MNDNRYPEEVLDVWDDDGHMPRNKQELAEAVVGHRIVAAEKKPVKDRYGYSDDCLILTLDTGNQVKLSPQSDCCAYTEVEKFLLHPESVDHIITGVGTTEGYTEWHIYADFGDILEMTVDWSCGNPFYYAYGFVIEVEPMTIEGEVVQGELTT